MVFLQTLFRDFLESKAFNALLNIICFVTDYAFMTKSGELGVFIGLQGPDSECKEPAAREAVVARICSALRVFGARFIVNTYFIKRSNPDLPCGDFRSPLVREVVRNRVSYLKAKGAGLYSFDSFMVVLVRPDWESRRLAEQLRSIASEPIAALKRVFLAEKRIQILNETVDASLRGLEHAARSFVEQTGEDLNSKLLPKQEAFLLYRRLINPDPLKAAAVPLLDDMHVDYLAADSVLECHRDRLELDGFVIKTLTLKQAPLQSFANIFGDLIRVRADLVISTEWNVFDSARAAADVRSRRRHWHNTKASLLSQVGSENRSEREILYDDSKEALVKDSGDCLREMEMGHVALGQYTLTVTIIARSREEAERATAEVMKVVGTHDGSLNEERYNGLNAFLAALPGGHPYNLRKLVVTNENHADMVPWFQPAPGERTNDFLGADYLAEFETEDQSLYYFNLHVQDVGHTLILGPTGTGKSFLLNFLITHAQKYESIHSDLHAGS